MLLQLLKHLCMLGQDQIKRKSLVLVRNDEPAVFVAFPNHCVAFSM